MGGRQRAKVARKGFGVTETVREFLNHGCGGILGCSYLFKLRVHLGEVGPICDICHFC